LNPNLLIVDDDEDIRTQLKWGLADDYEVSLAEDRLSGMKVFHDLKPPVVLLDLGLPPSPATPLEGLAMLSEVLEADPRAKVIIASGQSEKHNALEAIGGGAYDFLCKPVDMEELKLILRRAFYVAQLESEHATMRSKVSGDSFEGMLGNSPKMQVVFDTIRKVAASEVPVLILGESGTGKEMAARAIHTCSDRRDGPFVAINCGAIPENLLESELFGHERGSFTGAHGQRKGRVEMAAGGTLFLDEIGELPLALQVKILRFLQDRIITRVGGRTDLPMDVRVVAATNSDLKKQVANGAFREDLFYRLAVVVLQLPALRERAGDVTFLANAFLRKFGQENGRKALKFGAQAGRAIATHDWPGNVRELENRIRRATIMANSRQISVDDLELRTVDHLPLRLKEAREELEREMVALALQRNGGKISGAAQDLGISRPTLYELMDKLGVKR